MRLKGTQTLRSVRLFSLVALALMGLCLSSQTCSAQIQATQTSGPTDREELEAFLDSIFVQQMEKGHIPGAVFALVKDGDIFFAKGYGFANIEIETRVDPNKTLFRVASVSKLFTATAVMQLAEWGLIGLDDSVNKHLKLFQLEDTYPEPVTVAHLLTHTGWGSLAHHWLAQEHDSFVAIDGR